MYMTDKAAYVKFDVPKDLQDKILSGVEIAKESGKIRKGTNEVTKAVERNDAKFVVIAMDVQPPEVVAHIPLLCNEKKVPYAFVNNKNDLGSRIRIQSAASVAVIEFGKSEEEFKKIIEEVAKLNK
ncbi:MAG: 50S ribosomal protein L7Ae [Thermoplasmata archaeon]